MESVAERCAAELIGCIGPVPFPAGSTTVSAVKEAVGQLLARCSVLGAEDVLVDCSEFPCIAAIREVKHARASDAGCLGPSVSAEMSDRARSIAPEFADWRIDHVEPLIAGTASESRARARFEPRMRRLALKLADASTSSVVLEQPMSCEEALRLSEPSALDCDDARGLLGCGPPDPALVEATRVHFDEVEEYVADLERRCAPFAAAPWFLDCRDVPCFLGVPTSYLEDEDLRLKQVLCMDKLMTWQHATVWPGDDGATVLPLTELMDHPDHWDLWNEREVYRTGDSLGWLSDRVIWR